MASNYTANYGLCQWEPGDKFLREEFNGDNEKLDTVLERAEEKADRALSGLEAADYNLYNLLLQNDYEGKYTGYKKALLYDGFMDGSGIEDASPGFLWSKGQYTLSAQGESDRDMGIGGSRGSLEMESSTLTARGNGSWTGFTCKLHNISSATLSSKVEYTIIVNGETALAGTGSSVSVGSRSAQEHTITFSQPVPLARGDLYCLHLKSGNVNFVFYCASDGSSLGGQFHIQPLSATTGTLTTVSRPLPACGGLMAWVRHTTGATVTFAVTGGEGEPRTLTPAGSRTTQNLQRVNCTESAFRLDEARAEGACAFSLGMALGALNLGRVYDYGVVLLP